MTHSRGAPHATPDDAGDNRAAEPTDAKPTEPVDALAGRYVDEFAALDPVAATLNGITGHDDQITDYSPDGFAARAELDRRTLAALDETVPHDGRARTARYATEGRYRRTAGQPPRARPG